MGRGQGISDTEVAKALENIVYIYNVSSNESDGICDHGVQGMEGRSR